MKARPMIALWVLAGWGLVAVSLVVFFLHRSRVRTTALAERVPGMDQSGAVSGDSNQPSPITLGTLVAGPGRPANIAGTWPSFRGEKGDNIVAAPGSLARSWPEKGPKKLWEIDMGEGYAGPAVWNGRIYLLDYDQASGADALRCLSLADGQEIWRFTYPVRVKRNHGMSRTVPAVDGRYVIGFGPKCHVVCLDATTGEFRWGIDLVREHGAEVPQWYAGQCPLIDGDRVILAPGGDALVIAVELATGKVLWKSPNPNDWKMTHVSIAPIEFGGRRQYVYCGSGGVAGVAADTGEILWQTDAWQISIATIATPVPVGEGRIFLSGGYNAGSMMLGLKETGEGKIVAEAVFRLKAQTFGATQQTPIFTDGHIYGVRPDGQLACLDLEGKVRWASGGTERFGLGPFLKAGGLIFALNDDGWLTMAEVDPSGYRRLAKARVLQGHEAWAPMALVAGRLLARDLTRMVCLDLRDP